MIKKCKTSLERQVREAVRIQLKGNVLNKKGTFNRCKLTRMVVDEEWEKKVWEEAWEPREEREEVGDTLLAPSKSKRRRKGAGRRPSWRRKGRYGESTHPMKEEQVSD